MSRRRICFALSPKNSRRAFPRSFFFLGKKTAKHDGEKIEGNKRRGDWNKESPRWKNTLYLGRGRGAPKRENSTHSHLPRDETCSSILKNSYPPSIVLYIPSPPPTRSDNSFKRYRNEILFPFVSFLSPHTHTCIYNTVTWKYERERKRTARRTRNNKGCSDRAFRGCELPSEWMNLPAEQDAFGVSCARATSPMRGWPQFWRGQEQWGMPDEIQESVTRAEQLARNQRFQRRCRLSPGDLWNDPRNFSPSLSLISHLVPSTYASLSRVPPFLEFSRLFSTRERRRRREAISIDTDERVKKKEGKKKMGKHLRTVDRVGALKAHTGRVTGRCFRLIAGSTID